MQHIVRSGRSGGGRTQHIATSIAATLVAAVLLLGLVPPGAARAGEYDVYACTYPDGRTAPADGWREIIGGKGFEYTSGGCSSSQHLLAYLDTSIGHSVGAAAGWRLDAPPDTSIVRLAGEEAHQTGSGQSGGTPTASITSSSGLVMYCHQLNSCGDRARGWGSWATDSASWIAFAAACDGSTNCQPQDPKAAIGFWRLVTTLRDNHAPTSTVPGGSLVQGDLRRGTQHAEFSANDRGGGVKDVAIEVDGVSTGWRLIDSNEGRCDPPSGWYAHRVPCKLSVNASVSLDTAAYTDGAHDVRILVRDAAGNTSVVYGPRSVTFDNDAPSMGEPVVSGQAEEGQRLTCAAQALSGQSPRLAYEWLRSRADGSAMAVIAGADTAAYVLAKDDVGQKVRCRLTATDAGGSTTHTSGLSAGPFADGAVVKAAPPQPTQTQPSTTPGGTGTSPTPTPDGPADGNGQQTTVNVAGSSSSSSITNGASGASRTGAKLTAVFSATGQAIAGTAFGRTVAIRGQLDDREGAPIGDGLLELVARPDVPNASERPVATGRSRPDGTFSLAFAARLPTSELVLRHRAGPGGATLATTTLDLRVAAGLTFRATRKVRPRGLIRFSGRLLTGPVPRKGKVIELRARGGNGRWILFKTVRTDARGTFRAAYRLRRGFRNITYQFQAVARAESGYPYTAGASPVRRTRVR